MTTARNPNAPAGGAIMEDLDHEARTGEKPSAPRPDPDTGERSYIPEVVLDPGKSSGYVTTRTAPVWKPGDPDTYLPVRHRFAPAPRYLNHLAAEIHRDNAHWWTDPMTGKRIERNVGEMLMLMVSEIAEAMEGYRKDLMDDKLTHRRMIEVEMADLLIRALDFAGGLGLDLDGAVSEKRDFNSTRADHKAEARLGKNGKKF